jgi:hypothetical protein
MLKFISLFVTIFCSIYSSEMYAQNITAFKTGEQVTGMTKQCIYSGLGNQYVRTINSVTLCPLSIQVSNPSSNYNNTYNQPTYNQPIRSSITAFKTGENTTGMTKQCIYSGLGNTYVQTISSVALCPLSIQVDN